MPSASLQLRSLVVFRSLLNDPVLSRLGALLDADPADARTCVDAWCDFAAALFAESDDLSSYLLDLLMEDENIYMHQSCGENPVSPFLEACLENELAFMQELSRFDGSSIRAALDYDGFLPQWKTSELDFAAAYRERIATIHQRGYGIFSQYRMFTVQEGRIVPVKHPDLQRLCQLRLCHAFLFSAVGNKFSDLDLVHGSPPFAIMIPHTRHKVNIPMVDPEEFLSFIVPPFSMYM